MKPLHPPKSNTIPIFEAKVTRDLRIVWSVDIGQDPDGSAIRQIIRLWGVETHASIDHRGRYDQR